MAQKTGELDVMRLLASGTSSAMWSGSRAYTSSRRGLERDQARPAAQAVSAAGARAPSTVAASISPITAPNLKPWPGEAGEHPGPLDRQGDEALALGDAVEAGPGALHAVALEAREAGPRHRQRRGDVLARRLALAVRLAAAARSHGRRP